MTGAVRQHRPRPAGRLSVRDPAGSIFALDYTPLGADFAWMYNDGYGGTNVDCDLAERPTAGATGTTSWAPGRTTGSQTAMMGDADTAGRPVRADLRQPDQPGRPACRPDRAELAAHADHADAPDVVQVLPASSPNTAAGTPVTIEGNYFGTSTPRCSSGACPPPTCT